MSAQAERAEKLAELFKAAAEAGEASWPLYLNQALDTDMRADLEALLQQHARAKTFWETPALSHAAGSFVAESSRVGERIAQYEVLSLIGSGGMGDVYLARDLRLSRQVALKVIRHGMDSADIVRRFEHEERLLAGLNHPNIAQLYGGGVTNDGVPYFVLEHVQGIRIDQYCKGTGLRELLELFCKVCAAVTYAHQHLVVHRDLKPSNILVTAEGEPKLLDFGIAKLLDNTAEADFRTLTIAPILTPEYASPEHVLGETITTASDVYSLGVLLYELLTGVKPYRIEGRTPAEIARVVTEHEAARPSATVSRGQRSEIGSRKSFRGDLDNIVLMAMRKEPDRRYPSVAAYAADIRRHLDGLPVRARQDTLAYRSSKFIARNRIAVAAAVLVGLAVVAALIVSLVETQSARRERDLAERERLKAERINQFLQNILGAAAPETKGTE
ncbi:MAG TPA: serine/threonine-protein kinase, partial [Candidatus Binataceae bacterium]|nr:serine/threonine-protein kinase [Candidatus Binataceae bacterium]